MLTKLVKKLKLLRGLFKDQEILELKKFSNKTIEEAALKNDKLLAEISLIAYALHKLLSKVHVIESMKWIRIRNAIFTSLDKSIFMLRAKKIAKFEAELGKISTNINNFDRDLGNFVQNVLDKAKIKQASRAYSAGLSLSQAAYLTNADKKSVQQYIGQTTMH
ncbi:MAG: hypothetical protein Q7K42_05625, partial [Candidatus Diapherotrites archaeon]|nr:hypothetical protein [Candidatus Diapherotrites archaeon]